MNETNYKYGTLTEELLRILPNKPPTMAELLNGNLPYMKRFHQMKGAYGQLALNAMEEAASIKYSHSA